MVYEKLINGVLYSDNPELLNLDEVYNLLSKAYWFKQTNMASLQKTIDNSLCYCAIKDSRLIGFVRVITDYEQNASIWDMVIADDFRGDGIGSELVNFLLNSPKTKNVFRWVLQTKDAHSFYKKFGFNQSDMLMNKFL